MRERILKKLHDADRAKTRRQLHVHKPLRGYLIRNLILAVILGVTIATAVVFEIEEHMLFNREKGYSILSNRLWNSVCNERYDYQDGGRRYEELPGQKTENAWENRILGVWPIMFSASDKTYCALYDFKEERLIFDNSKGTNYVILRFLQGDELGSITYMICPEQSDLFPYPKDSILNPSTHVLSGYVKDGEIIIETYTDHLWETEEDRSIITVDLSNISTEGYEYIHADEYPYFQGLSVQEASEQGYINADKGKWYGEASNGKKYQIYLTLFGGSEVSELIKQEALDRIPDYQTSSESPEYFEKVHFFGRRYWLTKRLNNGEDDIGYVLTYEQMLHPMMIAGIYVIILLLAVAGAIMISEIQYSKHKAIHDVYEQRVTLTNALAHDLKTPLAVISGYAENLEDCEDVKKNRKYASQIRERVDGMNILIENILELNRGEMINVTSRMNIDMKEEWQRAIREKKSIADEKGLVILLDGEGSMKWNPSYVSRVTDNLLDNAVKYATAGSEITIRLEKGAFCVENLFDEKIETDGERLCKPFVRGDSARTGADGNGLGLAIVKQICEAHDTELNVEIRENHFSVSVGSHRERRVK